MAVNCLAPAAIRDFMAAKVWMAVFLNIVQTDQQVVLQLVPKFRHVPSI